MGYGGYSHDAHQALISVRTKLPDQEVFKQRDCHPLMYAKGLRLRESRDSDAHPQSLGVAFALDVTGSMGEIPVQLARQELPRFMRILAACGYNDAQILFMAVGDAHCDRAPMQLGQFESTAELMDQWLTSCFLEAGGGGNGSESYELALYALAEHTEMDCWVKRRQKGFLFMTGDELPFPAVSRKQVANVIGDTLDDDIPTEEIVAAVSETFHPFFLIPDFDRRRDIERRWRDLLGDHVICLERPQDACFAAASLIALTEGHVADVAELQPLLEKAGPPIDRVGAILRAVTPYAATLGRAGAPEPALASAAIPAGDGKSLWKRFFQK